MEYILAVSLIVQAALASPFTNTEDVPPLITPSPVLERRDYPSAGFIGYVYYDDGSFDTDSWRQCKSDLTYTYSFGYASCCSGPCTPYAECYGDYASFGDGRSVSCTYCTTMTIYYSTDDLYPAWYVGCATTDKETVLLRTDIEDFTTSSSSSRTTYTTTTTTSTSTSTPTTTTTSSSSSSTSPIPVSTTTVPPIPTEDSKSDNGAIIGGAVGGSVGFIALVGLGLFLFFRRRRNTHPVQPNPPMMQNPPPNMMQPIATPPAAYAPPPQGYQPPSSPPLGYPPSSPPLGYQPPSSPPGYVDGKWAHVATAGQPGQQPEYQYPTHSPVSEIPGSSPQGYANNLPPLETGPNRRSELA
ncbi:hypothetical protein CC78DRAFT_619426 [Lojkania enalia]|uniref:Uncharacterized protein n=1 Tax=Lojkania enalia TaxID=147567 RepID=A0A9P4N0L0_9PLEO|nr:hypothetical protein CC78DRAFT_619426 [Didymosphaeria enalia]